MRTLINKFKHVVTFGGVAATTSGIIQDVLTPLSSFGTWFFLSVFVLGIVTIFLGYFLPNLFQRSNGPLKDLWYIPLGISFFISSIAIAGVYEFNEKFGHENGQLSDKISLIELLQQQTGILTEINNTLEKSLDIQTRSLATHKSIESNTRNTFLQSQELTSTLAYDLNALHEALLRGDIDKLHKFHLNGFDLSDVKLSRHFVEPPLIIVGLRQNKKNYDEVIALLLDLNVVKLNEQFEIKPAYSDSYNHIWRPFMSKGSEAESLLKNGTKFSEYQKLFFDKYGYVIPDSARDTYESEQLMALSSSFIGAPQGAKVTLRTEAQIHKNTQLLKFIDKHEYSQPEDIIYMNNNMKIMLSRYTQ